MTTGKVKRQAQNQAGKMYGKANDNLILDTQEHKFPDRTVSGYTANTIANNMMAQCNTNINHRAIMDTIIDHRTNGMEVLHKDWCIKKGHNCHLKMTKGWLLCVQWKDRTTSWERLANMKESYPFEVAEYAKAYGIGRMPAFAWQVPHVLKKQGRIILAVNKRYIMRTHKFGIEIPKTVE